MSLNLARVWPLLVLVFASEVWALGLGDIRLGSALNEPLRAEIELLSTTQEELDNLKIQLASAETFARYGLDRPLFLQRLAFKIVNTGGTGGTVIRITSQEPVTEPFITFLVEATWSRGRLLREYTLLLDPPTFAPPPVAESATAVTAPRQSTQTDSGRIERPVRPQQEPAPAPAPSRPVQPSPSQAAPPTPESFDTTPSGDYSVRRGDTLWRIAQRFRPDDRLNINQTMLAIFEANPEAFAGNINILKAGADLRIPSASEIFRISRSDALTEVQRQNTAWQGGAVPDSAAQPSLVLVPPDDEQTGYDGGVQAAPEVAGEVTAADRISQLEREIAEQESLFEINDDELAALRAELARLKGEEYPEPVISGEDLEAGAAEDETAIDTTEDEGIIADEGEEEIGVDEGDAVPDVTTTEPPRVVAAPTREKAGILERVIEFLSGFWGILIGILVLVVGVLVWFARRAARGDDEDSTGVWDALDADDLDGESLASTERLRALAREDDTAIVVVEQESTPARVRPPKQSAAETIEIAAPRQTREAAPDTLDTTGEEIALEDTFSSETAINLDQSDPVAEADFHMAYGLYDQAADLINGALSAEPERDDLLAKLCEIYFVWGNRDAFVDAAGRLRATLGDEPSPEWDKIVIMGRQIASDNEMFAGVGRAATRSVDLSFEGALEDESELDMDLAGDSASSDVIDLGEESDNDALDLVLDTSTSSMMPDEEAFFDPGTEATADMPTKETDHTGVTAEMPTAETPTIEDQFGILERTGELPSIADDETSEVSSFDDDDLARGDATAEIDLDDLGLELDSLTEIGLDETSERESLQADDDLVATGTNEAVDGMDDIETGESPISATDETGRNLMTDAEDTDVGVEIDSSLLDATGQTQILSGDMAVETASDVDDVISDKDKTLSAPGFDDDVETMLAPLDDESDEPSGGAETDDDFDFAKTEALPKDVFTGMDPLDDTGELPSFAGTDMDLDLDDLTAALRVSEGSDTLDQPGVEATVEQPRRRPADDIDLDVGASTDDDDAAQTARLAPEDVSDDLHDARTMTEVGTKLDLARAYVDMGDPGGARSILEEVLDEGDDGQKQQAQQLLDSLPG